MPISSAIFRGSTPVPQGFVVIFTHASAQAGSHSRSCASAASQGPVSSLVAMISLLVAAVTVRDADEETRASSGAPRRSEEHTSELQSRENLVCRLLLEKKKKKED